jgi:hypothetical protein
MLGLLSVLLWFRQEALTVMFRLQGHSVICDMPVAHMVFPSHDSSSALACFHLRNISGSPVQVAGIDSTCSCLTSLNTPFMVPANEIEKLIIRVEGPCKADGVLEHVGRLLVSSRGPQQAVSVRIDSIPRLYGRHQEGPPSGPIPDPMFNR